MRLFPSALHHELPIAEEVAILQEPIDRLIALADKIESEEVALETDRIIEEMRDAASSRAARFRQLEELALLTDKEPVIKPVVADTAEILLEEFESRPQAKNDIGINAVWSAIHAWDKVRDSEPTTRLCVETLNNFPGEGQANLARAFTRARDEAIPFDIALEEILTQAA